MTTRGYSESELVQNRAAVLLFGAREEERRAWAEEASRNFPDEGPLRTATTVDELKRALSASVRGVVFVPDVLKLGDEGQGLLLTALHQEERPKLIVGVPGGLDAAVAEGKLRDDLVYRLQLGKLDLGPNELREAIRARRQAAEKLAEKLAKSAPKPATKPLAKSTAKPAVKTSTKPTAKRPVRPAAKTKPASKKAPAKAKPAARRAHAATKKPAKRAKR